MLRLFLQYPISTFPAYPEIQRYLGLMLFPALEIHLPSSKVPYFDRTTSKLEENSGELRRKSTALSSTSN